jgi:hypothetical protein
MPKSQNISYLAADISARINQMEVEHDLLKYEVDGWCAWTILRFRVALELAERPLAKRSRLKTCERLAAAVKVIPSLYRLRRARYLAKTYTSALGEEQNGAYKDVYFDDLLLSIGDYFKIESFNNRILIPRRRDALLKSDLTMPLFDIVSYSLSRGRFGPSHIQDVSHKLFACLRSKSGLENLSLDNITTILYRFYWGKLIFSWLLRQIRPEYVLVADPCEYEIIAAAKAQGIKTVEFQHGISDRYNYWSYSWTDYAAEYKERMPVPDRIFLYGEYSKKELEHSGFWGDSLRVVGSIRMDQYRERRAEWKEDICTLVFTSQGLEQQKVIMFFTEFLKLARDSFKLRLYIKLHPVFETSKEPYSVAFQNKENVYVLTANEPPSTFELILKAHFHMSISSSCHYESLTLGVPTIILPFKTYEIALELHRTGQAFLVRNPRDLLDVVSQWRTYKVTSQVGEYYFKPDALNNVKRELQVAEII